MTEDIMKNRPTELAFFISSIFFVIMYTVLYFINQQNIISQNHGALCYPLTIFILGGLLTIGLVGAKIRGKVFSKLWPLAPMLYIFSSALTYTATMYT